MESIKLRAAFFVALFVGLFLLISWIFPLAPSLSDPRATWATLVQPTLLNTALHIAIYLGLTLLYLAAPRLLNALGKEREKPALPLVVMIFLTWLVCSGLLMAAAPAGESHDIFDYLFRGRMMTEYFANPLTTVPDEFGLAPLFTRYISWRKNVDTYGPVWEAASAAVAAGVRGAARWLGWWKESALSCPADAGSCRLLMTYISGYRLLAIMLAGLSGALIYHMVKDVRPALAPLALAEWLWNPLTLIVTSLGGHNDALMVVLLLAGWRLLQRQRLFWGTILLLLAAHVKLTSLIWLPACGLWIAWRWGWRRALRVGLASLTAGVALSWLLYAPFGGWQSLPNMLKERSAFLVNSPWRLLKTLLQDTIGWAGGKANQFSVNLANWVFVAAVLTVPLWEFNYRPRMWRRNSILMEQADRVLWRTLTIVSLCFLLLGAYWFQHWYVLWVIAPAALLPDSRLTRVVLPWLAFGALSSNALTSYLFATHWTDASALKVDIITVVIIWLPALLAVIISNIRKVEP